MIETTVKSYLVANNITAYLEMPEDYPGGKFCTIEKTGGGYEQGLSTATITIQSYGNCLADAASENVAVKNAMLAINSLPSITRVELNSDYNFTDTATRRYRYQAVYDLTYYEEATT